MLFLVNANRQRMKHIRYEIENESFSKDVAKILERRFILFKY